VLTVNKSATLQFIVGRQRHWAEARHLAVNASGRVPCLEDNLFAPLHVETRDEFAAGDGGEFGTPDKVGKMYCLYSSSALVCNVFDYWRKRPMLPLLRACDIGATGTELRFEAKFPTGVGRRPANLDVLITGSEGNGLPVAVESKFTELFQTGERDFLRPAYFRGPETWDQLPYCRGLAESLTAKEGFKCLKAGQLMKHALALTREFGRKRFVLLYLWYDISGSEAAKQHGAEAQEFGSLVGDDVLFRSETYQSVFQRLSPLASGSQYENYLRSRYFE
jgi:hypothetical protein